MAKWNLITVIVLFLTLIAIISSRGDLYGRLQWHAFGSPATVNAHTDRTQIFYHT